MNINPQKWARKLIMVNINTLILSPDRGLVDLTQPRLRLGLARSTVSEEEAGEGWLQL
jgi:hypothetical protein